MARVYATRSDLVGYAPAGVTVPADPEATRKLTRASARVDRALRTAVYDVDDDGLPTDSLIAQALRDATCAQVSYWLETGDESGAAREWGSVGIGKVNLSRGSASSDGGSGPVLCDQAADHLLTAVDANGLALIAPGMVLQAN